MEKSEEITKKQVEELKSAIGDIEKGDKDAALAEFTTVTD